MKKYGITREFIEDHIVLFDPYMYKLCHTSCPPGLSIYAKDAASEMGLASAQSTHKRKKIGRFRS